MTDMGKRNLLHVFCLCVYYTVGYYVYYTKQSLFLCGILYKIFSENYLTNSIICDTIQEKLRDVANKPVKKVLENIKNYLTYDVKYDTL